MRDILVLRMAHGRREVHIELWFALHLLPLEKILSYVGRTIVSRVCTQVFNGQPLEQWSQRLLYSYSYIAVVYPSMPDMS